MHIAELLFTGDELVDGSVMNGNACYLSEELTSMGVKVVRHISVGDDLEEMVAAMQEIGARKPDLMVISGGLGVTPDDLTVEALARAVNLELEFDAELFARIEEKVGDVDQVTRGQYRKQAYLPAGARSLEPTGTAPGVYLKTARTHVFALPGVPREMVAMFQRDVKPILMELGAQEETPVARLKVAGIRESELASKISDLNWDGPVRVSTVATPSEITIVLRVRKGGAGSDVELDRMRHAVEERLGEYVFTDDDRSMAEVTADLLQRAGKTVSFAESCTGGLITKELTDSPGSSSYMIGGAVVYSDSSKIRLLKVDPKLIAEKGAVSPEVAEAMATGTRERFGADIGVAVTGLAGPGTDGSEKPVGTIYIALADADGIVRRDRSFTGDRDAIRQQSAMTALNLIRSHLAAGS